MCRNSYAANWKKKLLNCPNFHDSDGEVGNVTVTFKKEYPWGVRTYKGMVDFWNTWHKDYLSSDIPRIFVRYEDLLFKEEEVIGEICECVGGKLEEEYIHMEGAAKQHGGNDGEAAAQAKYGDVELRVMGYNDFELEKFDEEIDKQLMEMLGYPLSGLNEVRP